ncbi:hypothetical protein [Oceanobacillus sp. CF4.6]|uniref:hypothetical protein n=1 Tax=Oceanobacillus sp. CF4.6 TaxID=3373080 RepID=UPI003EE5F981
MRKLKFIISLSFAIFASMQLMEAEAAVVENDFYGTTDVQHDWKEYGTDINVFQTDSHDVTYWKNFMRYSRTCNISHKVKTVVYYCELHDHTKSETFLEDITHSVNHSH